MRKGKDEIGFVSRLAISLLALFLVSGLWSGNVVGLAFGAVGLALLAAATGLVELAMALWYRNLRHAATK